MTHGLALGCGEAGDVADDGLGHVGLDVLRGALLGVAADLTDHHHAEGVGVVLERLERIDVGDRKSTRLNSSHVAISYAVFCLKKKIIYNNNCYICQTL